MGGQILLDEPWPVRAGCCGIYFFCSFPRFSQCLWRRQWRGGDPWRAMGGYAPRAAPLAVAPQALHCAFQEQKKCRGKRQSLAAARARPQRKIPPWSVPASRPGAVAATEARPQQHTASSKRPLERHSATAWQGSGGAQPPGDAPAHASSIRHERALPACAVPAAHGLSLGGARGTIGCPRWLPPHGASLPGKQSAAPCMPRWQPGQW